MGEDAGEVSVGEGDVFRRDGLGEKEGGRWERGEVGCFGYHCGLEMKNEGRWGDG